MRSAIRNSTLIRLAACVALAAAPLSCSDSKTVTGPSTGMTSPSSANVSGVWSGTFTANDSGSCAGSSATANFQQNGTTVTGLLTTSACGVAGYFKGTVDGDSIAGAIKMTGCVGGGVSGTISAKGVTLSIGDLTKPLVTGDRVLMAGGSVALHR
jgi:hypothetical protein